MLHTPRSRITALRMMECLHPVPRTFQWLSLLLMLIAVVAFPATVRGEPLRAGIATIDITPPVPFRMCGGFSQCLSTGTKDPLMAKAVVFKQGDQRAVLVFCDIAQVSLDVSTRAREQASRETGIPAQHMAIAATHTHMGPLYFGALRKYFHERTVKKHGSDIYEKIDYSTELVKKLVRVIKQAAASMKPVQVAAGYAREERLSFNRRFHMKNGTVRFNPGQLNPSIVRPAGPIDPEVGIVTLQLQQSKRVMGSIVSFSLHLATMDGTKYSADFPKVVEDHLRRIHDPNFTLLFGAGTCGDINHIDVKTRKVRSTQEIGTMLGTTIEKRIPKLTPIRNVSLAVRSAHVNAPLQTFGAEQIAAARKNMERADSGKLSFLERVKAYKTLAVQLRKGTKLPMEVQVFRLSRDVAIVTLPGEVFVDLGIAIKQASPFKTTLVIELTNDGPGYIPTRKGFSEGSYETVNSRIKPGGGEMMVATAVRLLKELSSARSE